MTEKNDEVNKNFRGQSSEDRDMFKRIAKKKKYLHLNKHQAMKACGGRENITPHVYNSSNS